MVPRSLRTRRGRRVQAQRLGHALAATDLRARWRAGERELPELAPAVRTYLAEHTLYR